jgi:hypothetical protein
MAIIGYLTAEQRANDDLHHGEITSLPFGDGNVFSILVVAKVPLQDIPNVFRLDVDCQLIADEAASPHHLYPLWDKKIWSQRNLIHIPATAHNIELLTYFSLYWAAGEHPPVSNVPGPVKIGYISNDVSAKSKGITKHGTITSLPWGDGTTPARILLAQKDSSFESSAPDGAVMIDCFLRGDETSSPYFVYDRGSVNDRLNMTEEVITKIPDSEHNQDLLEDYFIYWYK